MWSKNRSKNRNRVKATRYTAVMLALWNEMKMLTMIFVIVTNLWRCRRHCGRSALCRLTSRWCFRGILIFPCLKHTLVDQSLAPFHTVAFLYKRPKLTFMHTFQNTIAFCCHVTCPGQQFKWTEECMQANETDLNAYIRIAGSSLTRL